MAIVLSGSLILSGSLTATGGVTISGSIASASYASTGSYSFNALTSSNALTASSADTLYVRNNLTALGTITAQTLNVQQVTSSVQFITGSTKFGSLQANTHEFTGSVGVTGSLTVNGAATVATSVTVQSEHAYYFQRTTSPSDLYSISANGSSAYLYNHTSSSVLMTWLEGGNVGIGTTSPSNILHLYGTDGNSYLRWTSDVATTGTRIGYNGTEFRIDQQQNADVTIRTNGGERMRITAAGNVGIGTSSPSYSLDVSVVGFGIQHYGNSTNILRTYAGSGYQIIEATNSGVASQFGYEAGAYFLETAATRRMYVSTAGNIGIGTSSPLAATGYTSISINNSSNGGIIDLQTNGTSVARLGNNGTSLAFLETRTATPLYISTNDTTRIVVASGGDVYVGGATSLPGAGSATTGVGMTPSGAITAQRNAATVGFFGRGTNDGELFALYRGTSQVGAISVTSTSVSFTSLSSGGLTIASTGAATFASTVTAQSGFKLPANGNGTSPTLAYNNSIGFGVNGTGIFFGNTYNSDLTTGMQLRVTNSGGTDLSVMTITSTGNGVITASGNSQFRVESTGNFRVNSDSNGLIGYFLRSGAWKGTSENNLSLATDGAYGISFFTNGSGTEKMLIRYDGAIFLNSFTYGNTVSASPRTLYIDSAYALGGISSTRKSKINIQDINDINWLYNLNPVSFNYRKKDNDGNYTDEYYNELAYGLIAEDTSTVADFLINYDNKEDGGKEIAGIEYARLITPMLKAIQEQQAQIDELKAKLQ